MQIENHNAYYSIDIYVHANLLGAKISLENIKKNFEEMRHCYRHWYFKYLPREKDARILDVGCGMGHFLYFLINEGYNNVYGIDISPEEVSFVKKFVTSNVMLIDAFRFLSQRENEFDVIVLNDIIEHFPKNQIVPFLTLVHKALKRGGKCFIKTVNAANPFNLRGRYIDFTHEIAFTERSLLQVLRASGFKVLAMFGDDCPAPGLRGRLQGFAKKIFFLMLRKLFLLQGIPPPAILDRNIIAIAVKT
ncbi:MAG: class I SAM-dependent methyltransferase [Candidatus Verstraetearchaeota archaeon]|nr:class I SAM-dependent methyltransferase [Candidatus Verstraetearchaeota archaeon]